MKKITKILVYVFILLITLIIIFFIAHIFFSNKEETNINKKTTSLIDVKENNSESYLPVSFKANYISFQKYSSGIFKVAEYPRLESWVENGTIECDVTPLESSLPLRMTKKEINGNKYCIGASSEGAAGSVYTQYAYTTVLGDKVYLIKFLARYSSCDNYSEEERAKCKTERENFDLDVLVDKEIEKIRNN